MKRKLHLPAIVSSRGLSPQEHTFCLLHAACGLSAADSYLRSFPTAATRASCACLASRLLGSPHIQAYLLKLETEWQRQGWDFNAAAIKD